MTLTTQKLIDCNLTNVSGNIWTKVPQMTGLEQFYIVFNDPGFYLTDSTGSERRSIDYDTYQQLTELWYVITGEPLPDIII